eukprot:764636-Hanusia_phi.AAC.1
MEDSFIGREEEEEESWSETRSTGNGITQDRRGRRLDCSGSPAGLLLLLLLLLLLTEEQQEPPVSRLHLRPRDSAGGRAQDQLVGGGSDERS